MSETTFLKLKENIIIRGEIELLTGLHIGGSKETLQIGELDNPVIKDPLTGLPIIPGSSLKGKMRSLIEVSMQKYETSGRYAGEPHASKSECNNPSCPICVVFGSLRNPHVGLTRLIVRDSFPASQNTPIETELKTENYIDRIRGRAGSPRTFERVPAHTIFKFEFVYSVYGENNDKEHLKTVFKAMSLLEDSYLGGSGSRGYGQIKFKINEIIKKTIDDYYSGGKGENLLKKEGKSPSEILQSNIIPWETKN